MHKEWINPTNKISVENIFGNFVKFNECSACGYVYNHEDPAEDDDGRISDGCIISLNEKSDKIVLCENCMRKLKRLLDQACMNVGGCV